MAGLHIPEEFLREHLLKRRLPWLVRVALALFRLGGSARFRLPGGVIIRSRWVQSAVPA